MDREVSLPPPPYTTELDVYIYDYLIQRNLLATAEAFVKETEVKPFATDPQKIDVPGGFLSDWWSIFWPTFISSPGDPACPEGHAPEQKALEVSNHFSQAEEQIQQSAATLANANRSNDGIFNHTMHQDPVADSPQMNSQEFHQLPGVGRMDLVNSHVYKRTAPRHMPQPYQQPPYGKCADDMLDLSGDVVTKKTMGIIIEEVLSLKASSKKIFCCDFSSDGALLASAGDENKVFIWNLRNNLEHRSWEAHSSFITDISFHRNEAMLATASSDKTMRLWDTSQGDDYCVQAQSFTGHNTQVSSVDFNPKHTSLLCSCDDGGKVLYWKIGQPNPRRISKATGKAKVRFHPHGNILASAIGHTVNITDVETDERCMCFQGNRDNKPLHSICWNERINCLACVSDNCARVWSTDGQPVRELNQNGYFRSCSFHPKYPNTLVIGGYETITLWNFAENKVESVQAHDCYVLDLDGCLATGLLASASRDGCVKVWR
nr:transcriptional corepressor LEUNIG-like isoform X2 [Setaria viridis]